jgi:hypothetical protein
MLTTPSVANGKFHLVVHNCGQCEGEKETLSQLMYGKIKYIMSSIYIFLSHTRLSSDECRRELHLDRCLDNVVKALREQAPRFVFD